MSAIVGKVRAAALVAGLAAAISVAPAANAATTVKHVAGNFVGDGRDEIFEYRSGSGPDYLFAEFTKDSGRVQYVPYGFPVTGAYTPFAGDFDGDGHDELFLYGAGPSPDHIWDFVDVTTKTQIEVSQGSLYFPVVGDYNGDGIDDILWYAPGVVADEIWEFLPGGTFQHTVHPITLTGDYVALPGNFTGDGGDDVILYGRGDIADHLVDFEPGSFAYVISDFGPLTGDNHRPFTLDAYDDGWTDILFYNTAATADPLWNFTPPSGAIQKHNEQATGTFDTASGDFFGDGYDDVYWFGSTTSVIWDWAGGVNPVVRGFGV